MAYKGVKGFQVRAAILFSIFCVSMSLRVHQFEKTKVISTKYGQLQGEFRDVHGVGGRVATYLGVPYATPPVGANRFSPTRTLSQWVGVHKAINFGPACPQKLPDIQNETTALEKMSRHKLEALKRALPSLRHQSEDCLYLNVYVPQNDLNELTESYPVLVYVHGPSYEWGSASLYDGSVLAARGSVIVVTINYRLGILGFLKPNVNVAGKATVANYGLMDQLAALHWIQENIAQFGGNKDQVTVMGHGTGAACLNFLVISPASAGAGLFRRAILMSGSALSSWALVDHPTHYAVKAAVQLRCDIPENVYHHYEVLLHCFRNRTVEELLKVDLQTPQFKSSIGPSVDGVTIKQNWRQEMGYLGKDGKYTVDVLLGFTKSDTFGTLSEKEIMFGFERQHRDRILRTFVANNYRYHLQEILLAITAEYTDWTRPVEHKSNIREITTDALHDAMLVAPIVATADQLSSDTKNTFLFVLDTEYDFYSAKSDFKKVLDELSYVFGAPLGATAPFAPSLNYTKAEVLLSETVINFWTNFVKKGSPMNAGRDGQWEPYDKLYQRYLELGQSRNRARNHFRASKVALWTWLLPGLERVGARYGPDSPFHKLPDHHLPETFSGPIRPWGLSPSLVFPTTTTTTTTYPPTTFGTTFIPRMNIPYSLPQPDDVMAPLEPQPARDSEFPYTTALGVTVAIGCSLLLLNILAFAAIYYNRRDTTRGVPKRPSETTLRSEQPEIVTDSPEGKPLGAVHPLKVPSPTHCDTLRSSLAPSCESDQMHEWPPNYSSCCMQDIQEQNEPLQPMPLNGTSTIRRSMRPPISRSISIQGHDDPAIYRPVDPNSDPSNFSEIRL